MPLFSGSRAVCSMDRFEDEPNDDYESYAMRQNRIQPHGGQLMLTTQVTKTPPGFDRKTSWLACDFSALGFEKWGPAFRNRLEGEAAVCNRLLDRAQFKQPSGRGIEYCKEIETTC